MDLSRVQVDVKVVTEEMRQKTEGIKEDKGLVVLGVARRPGSIGRLKECQDSWTSGLSRCLDLEDAGKIVERWAWSMACLRMR